MAGVSLRRRVEHHLQATVEAAVERPVRLGRLAEPHAVGEHVLGMQLALLDQRHERRPRRGDRGQREAQREPALQQVAQRSGGQSFQAVNSKQLQAVYKDLQSQMVKDKKKREITVGVAAAALGCLLIGALLSGLWFRRLV